MSRTNDQNIFTELNIYTASGIHFGGMVWTTSSTDGDEIMLGAQYPSRALLTQQSFGDVTVVLPDARMYPLGFTDIAVRTTSTSVGSIAVVDGDRGPVGSVPSDGGAMFLLADNSTRAGNWILLAR